jgi:hypothetical protein
MGKQIVVLLLALASTVCNCQGVEDTTFQGTLPQALLLVAQTFHVSVLGEIVDPIPSGISIKFSRADTAPAVLATLVAQCPGYVLFSRNEAFIVAQKDLFDDLNNPMNQVLRDYQIPSNLGRFRLSLPNEVSKAEQGIQGYGELLNGPTLPKSISPSLKTEVLHDQTAREILLHVAGEVGNLYSVLVLPSAHPAKQMQKNTSFQVWDIAGGPGLSKYISQVMPHPDTPVKN